MHTMATEAHFILDDRHSDTLSTGNGARWHAITDSVMGGKSTAHLQPTQIEGRACLRLIGEVSLDNNGGFAQASLDLDSAGLLDASGYRGIEIDLFGNDETYNLHLRSADTRIVWQSYRASFTAPPRWQKLRLPFTDFQPHRVDKPLDPSQLRRIGIVAIGREMRADICVARLSLYP
jgi:hypothetical protein